MTSACPSAPDVVCCSDERRERVRASGVLAGLDYVEVDDDGVTLCVHLFGTVPALDRSRVTVEGGERITGLRVVSAAFERHADGDECLRVVVDRTGDFSTYCVCLVEPAGDAVTCSFDDVAAEPLVRAVPAGIDPRYACVPFKFRVDCPAGGDCAPPACARTAGGPPVAIDYLARDFAGFRQLLLDRLAVTMPGWQERHVPDLGITVVELFAAVADRLSYQLDAIATETYLGTARLRISVRRHARLLDYRLHEGCNARAFVAVAVERDLEDVVLADLAFAVVPAGGAIASAGVVAWSDLSKAKDAIVFEPIDCDGSGTTRFVAAHGAIHFYGWGRENCVLPAGATRATLLDQEAAVDHDRRARVLRLRAGDLLLIEEIRGTRTGSSADADPTHRCVVRLVRVEEGVDPLDGTLVLEIAWARGDALAVPIRLSGRTEPSVPTAVPVAKGQALTFDVRAGMPRTGIEIATGPARGRATLADGALLTYRPEADFVGIDRVVLRLVDDAGNERSRAIDFVVGDVRPCATVEVAIARGNLLLVDHGRTIGESNAAWVVDADLNVGCCRCDGMAVEVGATARVPTFALSRPGVTHAACACAPVDGPASSLLVQDPAEAIACVRLDAAIVDALDGSDTPFPGTFDWRAAPDLLDRGPDDRAFVAEIDDDGLAFLRFGDGTCGRIPAAGTRFVARYRVGNGKAGNVGSGSIACIAFRSASFGDLSIGVRNPLPATGGIDAETIDHAKQFAPRSYGRLLERAISATDYETIAAGAAHVQSAHAELAWTGVGYEADVALDVLANDASDEAVRTDAMQRIERARRLGHDVRLVPARRVPLAIALSVCVRDDVPQSDVSAAVRAALSDRALDDGSLGFFHPDRLTFGDDVAASRIVATVQAIDGVVHVEVTALGRLGDDAGRMKKSLLAGVVAIAPDELAELSGSPDFPERGRLTLTTSGGR